jgi:hypothetical protein
LFLDFIVTDIDGEIVGKLAEQFQYIIQSAVNKVINDPVGAAFHSPSLHAIEPASLAGFSAIFTVIMKSTNNNLLRRKFKL